MSNTQEMDALITDAAKDIHRTMMGFMVTVTLARIAQTALKVLECLAGLVFLASQIAVLAACGRYMGWW